MEVSRQARVLSFEIDGRQQTWTEHYVLVQYL